MEKSTEEDIVELFNKENCIFKRYGVNKYILDYEMENKNIYMEKIIDFSLIQLIYNLNPDIYEHIEFNKINENEAVAILLIKHFFEDIGFPQRYSFMNIKKIVEKIKFYLKLKQLYRIKNQQTFHLKLKYYI